MLLLPVLPVLSVLSFSSVNLIAGKSSDYVPFGNPIVLLGDSLTQYGVDVDKEGWSLSLTQHVCGRYVNRYDVLNRGFAGYNTRQYARMILQVLGDIGRPPSLITLMLGTNDSDDREPLHVPIAEYKQNLESMISDVKRMYPSSPLLVMTPPPTHADASPKARYDYRTQCIQVATEHYVTVLDTWPLFFPSFNGSFHQYNATAMIPHLVDHVHLSTLGNRVLYQGVLDAIRSHWPGLA